MKSNLEKMLKIRNLSNGKAALYFYGEIVDAWYGAWAQEDQYPEKIRSFLKEAAGKELDVYINSPGGSFFAALAISHMIKRHDAKTTCFVDGVAASAASVIALSCNRVVMPKNTYLMIHRASGVAWGNTEEMLHFAELLSKCDEGLLQSYSDKLRSNIDIAQIKQLLDQETWLTAEEAVKFFDIELGENPVSIAALATGGVTLKNAPKAIKDAADIALETERIRLLNLKKEGE